MEGTNNTSRIDANRPRAHRVIDHDAYHVELDLTPIAAGLLNDIARALRGNGHLLVLLANLQVGTPEHTNTRAAILARLQATQALTVQLGPDQALDLSNDLFDASGEPARCDTADCDNYATHGALCGHHDEVDSFGNALSGGRL